MRFLQICAALATGGGRSPFSAGTVNHKTVSGRTKAEAKARLDALERKLKSGVGKSAMTVGDLFKRWMDNYCKVDLKPTTWESYEMHVRCHFQTLAPIKLQELSKLDILEWKTAEVKKAARSLRSIAYSLSILKGALSKAEEWGLIEDNPAMKIRVGNIPEFEAKPFTLEEARVLESPWVCTPTSRRRPGRRPRAKCRTS